MDDVFWLYIGLACVIASVVVGLHARLQRKKQEREDSSQYKAQVASVLAWANEDEHYQGIYDNLRRHAEACALVLVANERPDDDGNGVGAEL